MTVRCTNRAVVSAFVAMALLSCRAPRAEADLLMHWDFDNVTGSTVTNTGTLGTTADGTLTGGVTVVSDATFGNVAQYDNAAGTYVKMGASGVGIQVGEVATVAAFYKGTDFDYLMDQRSPRTALILDNGGPVAIYDGGYSYPGYAASNLEDDDWHHVAVTVNGSTTASNGLAPGAVRLFVDGVSVGMASGAEDWDLKTGSTTLWGARHDASYGQSSGLHHDVRIYNEILGSSEIATLAGVSLPSTVSVDINGNGDSTAAGWIGWDPVNPNNSALDTGVGGFSASFATDGDFDVRITTNGNTYERNYGVGKVTGSFSADTPGELWQDQYFHNQLAGAPLTITLDDLKAGTYEFTIYNYYDVLTDAHGMATTDIYVNGVDSGIDATAYPGTTGQTAAFLEANAAATVGFTVASDNDIVTLEFRNPTGAHFGLNGFQLTTAAVPEPSGLALIVLGLAGLLTCAGRRKWQLLIKSHRG